ncbi:endonuclease domain-containing protein [Streptomyces sp. NPDC052000]|uniref:endonuclease domain-containing protein n=1 Tax=Streptomyces sp. NPDC052000 TaxID=3155676 RepID=UPI00344C7A2A
MYWHLYRIQRGRCAMCGAWPPDRLDHDHQTLLIRGLLGGVSNDRAEGPATAPCAAGPVRPPRRTAGATTGPCRPGTDRACRPSESLCLNPGQIGATSLTPAAARSRPAA